MRQFIILSAAIGCGPATPTPAQSGDPSTAPSLVVSPENVRLGLAEIVVASKSLPPEIIVANRNGEFTIPKREGELGLTVSALGYQSKFFSATEIGDTRTFTLERGIGLTVKGQVSHSTSLPSDIKVRVTSSENDELEVYFARVEADGSFAFRLPEGSYSLRIDSSHAVSSEHRLAGGGAQEISVPAYSKAELEAEAPEEVVAWLQQNAAAPKPADLEALFKGAIVVGLGEATHGTGDFSSLKHQIIAQLVRSDGFNVVALEANWAEGLAVNEYVVHGRGDLGAAVAGLHFWTIDTQEVVEMLQWLRRHNERLAETERVHVYGFDMQYADVGVKQLLRYIGRVSPEWAVNAEATLKPLLGEDIRARLTAYREGDESTRVSVRAGLARARTFLKSNRQEFEARTSNLELQFALQQVDVLAQAERLWSTRRFDLAVDHRNKSMADNIEWLRRTIPNAKVVAWAHNGHLARDYTFGNFPAGYHLAKHLGSKYVSVGFAFGSGAFRAWDVRTEDGLKKGVAPIRVELPPPGFAERTFSKVSLERYLIDLRTVPTTGPVSDWFLLPHYLRELGAAYEGDVNMELRKLGQQYDIVAFVRETHAAVPTPTGVRGPTN